MQGRMTLKEALKKKHKYNAKEYISSDGIRFQSRKEGRRWEELLLLKRAGEINNLNRQTPFGLLPKQYVEGKLKERGVKYVADFTYWTKDGRFVVEDVKSPATKTREYILKKKMMLYFHGIVIEEV